MHLTTRAQQEVVFAMPLDYFLDLPPYTTLKYLFMYSILNHDYTDYPDSHLLSP